MRVMEADGNYVKQFDTDSLYIYSGESYSVLLNTYQIVKNHKIYVTQVAREPEPTSTPPAVAILHYNKISVAEPAISRYDFPKWNNYAHAKAFLNKILADAGNPKPPREYNRRLVLLNTQNYINGYTNWAINNSLALPATPYLGSIKYGLKDAFDQASPPDEFNGDYDVMKRPPNLNTTVSSGVYRLKYMTTVDVILQNANIINNHASEVHPWHLHGHDFWVLGYGQGKFKKGVDEQTFNLKNAPLRNTAVIFPFGWTALRFVADDPGVWAYHCHIEPHLHLGMGVVFTETVERVDNIPSEAIACGLIGRKWVAMTILNKATASPALGSAFGRKSAFAPAHR